MIESMLIEYTLSVVLEYLKKKIITTPKDRAAIDFIYEDENKKIVGIEVKGGKIGPNVISNLSKRLDLDKGKIDTFILVTPEKPSKKENDSFSAAFFGIISDAKWLGVEEFFASLGLKATSLKDIENIQIAAITSNIERYKKTQIGLTPEKKSKAQQLLELIDSVDKGTTTIKNNLIDLRRQFPYSVLANLQGSESEIIEYLKIGKVSQDAIIILSDIKNFSTMVSAANADDLNVMMNKYYVKARNLVFEYGGILDKFIGDAVLAIFNYPEPSKDSVSNAIKFSAALISLGNTVLAELQRNMDHVIPTGTRIGIATGHIYALNIGEKGIEVSFVGDKINLAARLETNCDVNGVLISNVTRTKLEEADDGFLSSLDLQEKMINQNDAKGQISDIKAWQITNNTIESIANTQGQKI